MAWPLVAHFQPAKIDKVLLLKPIEVGNSQVISYNDENGNTKIVNVNQVIGKFVPDNCKVEVTIYKKGYYLGIWYDDQKTLLDSYCIICK
jgi:hypothetical protein